MRGDKKTKLLAKQLFKLSLANSQVSPEQVAGVLGYIEKTAPRNALSLLKLYQQAIVTELAKSHARVEHAAHLLGRDLPVDQTQFEELLRELLGFFVAAHGSGQRAVSSLVAASL